MFVFQSLKHKHAVFPPLFPEGLPNIKTFERAKELPTAISSVLIFIPNIKETKSKLEAYICQHTAVD